MTQEDLAKALGIGRSTVAMYEKGLREPNFETLEAIADYFNVSMSELIDSSVANKAEQLEAKYQEYLRTITKERQELLDATEDMTVDELKTLLDIIKAIKRK